MDGIVGRYWDGFYFLHVVCGELNYPGYQPLAQAVSDLTAATAPSREIASAFDGLCIIYNHSMHLAMCFSQRRVQDFRLGIYLFTAMEWTSAVGYTFSQYLAAVTLELSKISCT